MTDPIDQMTAIAGARVRFRHRVTTRLGLPDAVDVVTATGVVVATITATTGAVVITAPAGEGLTVERGTDGQTSSLRVVLGTR